MKNRDVYVVGAGISGVGASYFLKKHQISPTLIDSRSAYGGRAGYEKVGDTVYEIGRKNISTEGLLTQEVLNAHQINEFDEQHSSSPFVNNNKLFIVGSRGNLGRTLYSLFRTAGIRGCLQFINFMQFISRNKGELNYGSELMRAIEDQYDDNPLPHHFILPLAYGALRLFCINLCGTEPEETYYSTLMAELVGQQGNSVSIRGGNRVLFERMLNGQEVMLNTMVKKVVIENSRLTGLILNNGKKETFVPADKVIIAVPVHALKKMLDLPGEVSQAIDTIRYSPKILVVSKYRDDVFNEKFSSVFFDRNYHLGHVSASRSYEKNIVRYTFSGKKARTSFQMEDAELIKIAERELSAVLATATKQPLTSERLTYKVYRYENGICAYGAHFSCTRKHLYDYFSKIHGLALTGDYLNGHNMEGCLQSSKLAVDQLVFQCAIT